MFDPKKVAQEALDAANAAGKRWLEKAEARGPKYAVHDGDLLTGKPIGHPLGYMLDVCGNAHVQFKDRRSKNYKAFLNAGLVRKSGNAVLEINHNYRPRQEYGLAVDCAEAAIEVLKKHGITDVRVWSYVD